MSAFDARMKRIAEQLEEIETRRGALRNQGARRHEPGRSLMRRLEDQLSRMEQQLTEHERRHYLAAIEPDTLIIHGTLSVLEVLVPLSEEARERLDQNRRALRREPPGPLAPWTLAEVQASLLVDFWDYLRHVEGLFGQPGCRRRFWNWVRELLSQWERTDAELERLITARPAEELITMARAPVAGAGG